MVDPELQSVEKYGRHAAQVADKLSHLQDFFSAIAVFVNEIHIDYKQKMQPNSLRFR